MIFINTGAILARHLSRDQYHEKAQEAWQEICRASLRCFTSNFVL